MEKNLTTGSVFKTLLSFSLPFLLSYFLQTLYGMADLFIVGQFNGVESTTAVSIGSQVMHMLTSVIVGLAMGSTVTISRAVGAGNKEASSAAIGNTVNLFMGLSVVITALLLALVKPIVAVMSTPDEAVSGTAVYLTICFIGIPFITAYNIISSIFRGMGDSKSPMYFVAIACAANIGLDYLFIGVMNLGSAGAALGTTLSQTISVIISIWTILRKQTGVALKKEHFHPRKDIMHSLLKVGIPVAFQNGFIQISFIVITVIANQRGLNDAAAVGIVEKIISLLFLVPSSMLSAVSALAAQNVGASRHDRAKKTLWYAIMLSVSFGVLSVIVMQLAAETFVGLFSPDWLLQLFIIIRHAVVQIKVQSAFKCRRLRGNTVKKQPEITDATRKAILDAFRIIYQQKPVDIIPVFIFVSSFYATGIYLSRYSTIVSIHCFEIALSFCRP